MPIIRYLSVRCVTDLWASLLGFVAHKSEFTEELHVVEVTKEDMTNLWKIGRKSGVFLVKYTTLLYPLVVRESKSEDYQNHFDKVKLAKIIMKFLQVGQKTSARIIS